MKFMTLSLFFSFQFHTFWYRLHHMFLTCLLKRNPCPWFLWVWTPLSLYLLQSIYIATISSVNHPLSSRSVPSGGILPSSQYSCTFFHMGHTSLLSCCAFCGLTIYIFSSLFLLSFSATMSEHSYLQYPTPQYLKHFTSSFFLFCLCILISFLILYLIT